VSLSERPDGLLHGLVIDVPIFKAKDGNGISVMIPGGNFPAIKPKNMLVVSASGVEHETTAPDKDGANVADQLPALILTAYHAWQTTKNPVQAITFG
jgi:hypothetical protein